MSGDIKSVDLRAAWQGQSDQLRAVFAEVLESGWFILGPQVKQFEALFAQWCGSAHAVGVGNGTDAIQVALAALGVGPGDAVLTVSHTAVATVAAIELCGATPVLIDIDPDRFTMSPERLEATLAEWKLRPDLKDLTARVVLPVHLYGQPADMDAISAIAARNRLDVVEDCSQAHGARIGGRCAGTIGDAGTFSFYPTKNLGACGDGGAVICGSEEVASKVRELREYGWKTRYISDLPGMNSRLDELQAALLNVRLTALDAENERRAAAAATYDEALAGLAGEGLSTPWVAEGVRHVYHQYVIRTERRDELREHLAARGIETLIHYPVPVHRQPAYEKRIPSGTGGLPETERAAGEILSLPVHPWLDEAQVSRVAEGVTEFYR